MRNYFFIALLFLAVASYSQTRQLVVRGEGELKVSPDQATLNIQLNAHGMEFNQALAKLNERERDVLKKLEKLGYKKEQVKTSDFSVYENRVWWEGRSYDSGYVARQSMSLEFVNTKEKIGDLLNAFGESTTEAEISFSFSLSDDLKQKKSDEVVRKALTEARRKAALIAETSGVTLQKVIKIEYHVDQIGGAPIPMMDYRMEAKMAGGQSEGFEAKEITLVDGVVITYEIE